MGCLENNVTQKKKKKKTRRVILCKQQYLEIQGIKPCTKHAKQALYHLSYDDANKMLVS